MRITKIISTAIDKGKLIIKVLGLGSRDVQTVYNILPFGVDSNPVSGLRGIWSRTENFEDRILLGIILDSAISATGETRIYSTDANGALKVSVHLKNTGIIEIGGNADFATRYNKLNDAMQILKSDINTELEKIQVAITTLGGTYTKADIAIDISQAKINNIKTS